MFSFSGLKVNFSKCEIAGLGSLKGVLEAVCSLKSINLTTDTTKTLDAHFSYNNTLQIQNSFLDTAKRNNGMVSFEGRIIIFKHLLFLELFILYS